MTNGEQMHEEDLYSMTNPSLLFALIPLSTCSVRQTQISDCFD
jgi:hypothetical protein